MQHEPTKKKPSYPISDELRRYLRHYRREKELPVTYQRLLDWSESIPLFDRNGEDTLWQTVIYRPDEMKELGRHLTGIYALLKTEGDLSSVEHLYADRIDYCSFGNSNPFRVRIVNSYNDNQDYYYIKTADASRVYGLELEHLLSPNRMHYLTSADTLIEEHVVGIPGDSFIHRWMAHPTIKKVRLAKELVKFNERCFIRLLGDMRSYNFVVQLTPDFEETQIRIRAMDFDQQSYSGRVRFYLPQYFKENNPLVEFCLATLNLKTSMQYIKEEHAVLRRRIDMVGDRVRGILESMSADQIAPPEHVAELRQGLSDYYGDRRFLNLDRMGKLVAASLELISERLAAGHDVRIPTAMKIG